MSIIRFSMMENELFAPEQSGQLVRAPYDGRKRTGHLAGFSDQDRITARVRDRLEKHIGALLGEQAAALPDDEPVVFMVHGFQFDPADWDEAPLTNWKNADNPHQTIYHFEASQDKGIVEREQTAHNTGWPGRLGFEEADAGASGLVIGFGWFSNPRFIRSILEVGDEFHGHAYQIGTVAARALVALLSVASGREELMGRPLDIFCHSLGSHVVIRALTNMTATPERRRKFKPLIERLGRIIILGGSERTDLARVAQKALEEATDEGPIVNNFVIRGDKVLDHLAEKTREYDITRDQAVGHNGLQLQVVAPEPTPHKNWMDLQLDSEQLQKWFLERDNGEITVTDGPYLSGIQKHWAYYTFPQNMALYRDILRNRNEWTLEHLRSNGIPYGVDLGEEGYEGNDPTIDAPWNL